MTRLVPRVLSTLLTILFLVGAAIALVIVWKRYEEDPWTRDGAVQADVVQVSADVSGLVTQVNVHDNQLVRAGDILFTVDQERYAATLEQSRASVASAQANIESAQADIAKSAATLAKSQRDKASLGQKQASLKESLANLRTAEINVERSSVRAAVTGYVTNFTMRPGNYISSGSKLFALLDINSFYVLAYLEETKLHRFSLGDEARIELLGDSRPLWGHVDSLAAGIADRQKNSSDDLLPNITPTFSWIRLAQRVPVRVVIDTVPAGLRLVAGRTATVYILPTLRPVAPRQVPASGFNTNTAPTDRPPPSPPSGPAATVPPP